MNIKTSGRRLATLTSGALLAGGLVATPALAGLGTASAAPVALTYTCSATSPFAITLPGTVTIDSSAPTSVLPGSDFANGIIAKLDFGSLPAGVPAFVTEMAGSFEIPLTVGDDTATFTTPTQTVPRGALVFTGTGSVDLTAPAAVGDAPITVGTILGHFSAMGTDIPATCTPDAGQALTVGTVAVSEAADPAITASSAPAVSGAPKVGQALTATGGSYNPADAEVAYQWLLDGAAVDGASTSSYTPAASDLGKALSVRVTASKTGYTSKVSTVEAGTVAAGTLAVSGTPKVTGTPKVGKTLKAVPGKAAGAKATYQWLANGKAIKGATSPSLKLAKSLKGKKVSVAVSYAKAGYSTVVQKSKAVTVKK